MQNNELESRNTVKSYFFSCKDIHNTLKYLRKRVLKQLLNLMTSKGIQGNAFVCSNA